MRLTGPARSPQVKPAARPPRPDASLGAGPAGRRTLRIYLVKPSKYDDDGLVLRFRWGVLPSNTLVVLAGLCAGYARRRPEIQVQTVLWDEPLNGVLSARLIDSICDRAAADGVELVVALVGVQTNQYPRARDLALQFKRRNATVLMGGFHVSSHEPSRAFLASVGVSVAVGEAEGVWDRILDDHLAGRLGLSYRVTDGFRARTGLADIDVPRIDAADLPAISPAYLRSFLNPTFSTIDTSRGCPFLCSYCSVKNVMGRTMRARDPGTVLSWMREAYDRHGVRNLLIVDDDFFRSPCWEELLSGMIELRRGGRPLSFIVQADIESSACPRPSPGERETERHRRSQRFVRMAAEAGCFQVFVGFESFSPANLEQTLKFQNQDSRDRRRLADEPSRAAERTRALYRRAVEHWHQAGVAVHAGYIIGLPFDGPGCGPRAARDLAEIGVDLASFFAYTPLPGTEDHEGLVREGRITGHDFNDYDSQHFVSTHPRLGPADLAREYRRAYETFYGWRRIAWSLLTFHSVDGLGAAARAGMVSHHLYYAYSIRRGWHPMLGGVWRVRDRSVVREVETDREAAELYLGAPPPRAARPAEIGAAAPAPEAGLPDRRGAGNRVPRLSGAARA